jgi:oxygen-independent coproporphyrinogen-3 oxidase
VAGIYIHIPFCKTKCQYCDFYKTTSLQLKNDFLKAVILEINQRRDFLHNETIDTVYFGGGTPSVLSSGEIDTVLNAIHAKYKGGNDIEITLEANPDDLTLNYLKDIKTAGINRISIGIQSFSDRDLRLLNRRHSAESGIKAIKDALNADFANISIDLIFGIPGQSLDTWKENLFISGNLPVKHISAYHLTFHKGTPFYRWLKSGKIKELSDDESIAHFEALFEITSLLGFEQYEISNFAKNRAYSRHNSNYWLGKKYLGIGPAAHSFNGESRQWNISGLVKYLSGVYSGEKYWSNEILSEKDKLNEYIITGIRTKWGISLSKIKTSFGEKAAERLSDLALKYQKEGQITFKDGNIVLTRQGIITSDQITVNLMAD